MRSTKSSDRTLSLFSADNDARRESGSGHSSASRWAWASSAYSPWVGRPLTGGYGRELQSAAVAPISPQTREGLDEEIDGLRRQVEALKNEITKLKDAREQTAQTIAALRAAAQESRDSVPSNWYLDPVALELGIESQQLEWGADVPPLRLPPVRPASRGSSK